MPINIYSALLPSQILDTRVHRFSTVFGCLHGVVMTTFYYCSVNDQSGLPKNSFSKYACITLIHHNVPQDFRFNLRYMRVL